MGLIKAKVYTSKIDKEFCIRTASTNDAEDFLALGKSIMSENIYSLTQPHELNMTVEQEKNWLQENLDNPNKLVLVAEQEGQLIGQLDFTSGHKERISHTGEFGMAVHKDFRGQGIGKLLLQELIAWCKKHPSIEKINLCVHRTNERAINMYRKIGFEKEGCRKKDLKYGPSEYVDTILMGLFL